MSKYNNNFKLKAALLSVGFVTASVNAISGNIPSIAGSFPDVPLYIIEIISTIPSLTSMLTILLSGYINDRLGRKNTILFGCLLCGVCGVIPFFIQDIVVMIIARGLFGVGTGCISSTLLSLILYFFDGKVRSQMIGLQGSIGGLGSFVTTFIAGRLLVFGWHVSFLTYLIGFIVFVVILCFVPKVGKIEKESNSGQIVAVSKILFYSILDFISVCFATFFVIKCSTLITINGYGKVTDGATLIMFISLGSLLSGAMYGNIYSRIKDKALVLFYLLCALGFIIAGFSNNFIITIMAAFILGYGYMAFVPFLQEKVGSNGTRVILVLQSLGAFIAPYYGSLLDNFVSSLNSQFILTAVLYLLLTVIGIILVKKNS